MSTSENMGFYSWKFSFTWLAHIFKAIFQQHHQELLPALTRILRKDSVIFDVGSHAGQFSKLFSKISPEGFIFSLEPGTYARSILRTAIALNHINNIVVLPFGLSSNVGSGILLLPEKRKGSYGFGLSHIKSNQNGVSARFGVKKDLVPLITLDSLVEQLALTKVDFIKMDIEGWEMRALIGGQKTLNKYHPRLYIEMNDDHLKRADDTLQSAWDFLSSMGYTPYSYNTTDKEFIKATGISNGNWWWFPFSLHAHD